jgi:hypothetical protein
MIGCCAEILDELTRLPEFAALDPTTSRNLRAWIEHPSGDFARSVAQFYPDLTEHERCLLATPLCHNENAQVVLDHFYLLDSRRRRTT